MGDDNDDNDDADKGRRKVEVGKGACGGIFHYRQGHAGEAESLWSVRYVTLGGTV